MKQKTSYAIQDESAANKVIGLDEANNSNRHDHKGFVWLCRECLLDKQYLGWQLEA